MLHRVADAFGARIALSLLKLLVAALALIPAWAARSAPPATAFIHVNVVPMDREQVLLDQTVIVSGQTIARLGRDVPVPAGARVIDARGKYLSPGLADMHTHSQTREDMRVYLANGVTTVLNLGGASSDFVDQLVPLLNKGERPGPHVYLALRIDGTPEYGQLVVKTPAEARAVVRIAKTNGYQFIKVYNDLSANAFAAVAEEARLRGLGIVGHYVRSVPLSRELEGGHVLIAHLEELMYGLFTPSKSDPLAPPPDDVASKAIELLKAHRGYVVADLATFDAIAEQWGKPAVLNSFLARPEAGLVPFEWRLAWRREGYVDKSGSLDRRAAFEAKLAKRMDDAGIGLFAGTDAPTIPGTYPGYSLHDDLERLVKAGISRFDAMSTATRIPGEFIADNLHEDARFGEVTPGYRADLVLTKDNPLRDL
ncbi:MAG TPA: amidohydrolase, partial [Sphingomicrobium sp.]|nr:amidohydrolase [Sphingomicrobium sp.]